MSTGRLIHQMLLLNVELLYFLTPSSVSQIPVNYFRILIYMVFILMLTVSQTTTGTLVCSSLYSMCTLRSSVLQNISISTGFLLHFSNLCLGCVFHKIKRSTRFFLFSLNKHETLKIHQIDNAKCLVQTITNKVI